MTKQLRAAALAAAFLACILAANYVTSRYGLVWVFGLTATAGTYFAGATFVLRDSIQDLAGRWAVLGLIVIGATLSFAISLPAIAVASAVAFLCSEAADLAVYTPLRERGYVRAAVASNVVGAVVDTVLFLWIAGFGVSTAFAGQIVGKLVVTLVVVAAIAVARGLRRVPVAA